jgi:hypothetical protein
MSHVGHRHKHSPHSRKSDRGYLFSLSFRRRLHQDRMHVSESYIVTTKTGTCITSMNQECPSERVQECFFVPDTPQPWSKQFSNNCYSAMCYNTIYELGFTLSATSFVFSLLIWTAFIYSCLNIDKINKINI